LDFLPLSNKEKPPFRITEDPNNRKSVNLDTLIPENANNPYDMKELITNYS
jgi:propionyl-CoA carboxylase beta chain